MSRIILFALLCLIRSVEAQKVGDDVTTQFKVADGMIVTLWASTPQVLNPTNMDIDKRGRIWVTEAVNYRDFRNPKAKRLSAPKGDRIRILADTDGDGVCDSSRVFVQDEDLVSPLGIAVIGNRVFVSCSPHLLVYTDTDGDDKADKKEILLTGFGGHDHDHGLHAVVGGPDGRLWFNVGNAGPHLVTTSDRGTLRSGSIYRDASSKNAPNQKSDDGQVWTGGLALSMRPDGTDLRVHSHNFRNSYELTIDAFGDVWQNDNDDDGNESCRIAHLSQGANMGYFSRTGARTWGADRRPGQSTQVAHWHQDDPGVFPPGEITGAGAPTGILMYEQGALGAKWEGTLFSVDAGRSLVVACQPRLDGAGFRWKSKPFLAAEKSESRWFRPSDMAVGADGALYISDWYDSVVGGHLMRDTKGLGRIYRVAWRESDTASIPVDLTSLNGAIVALAHPTIHVRFAAEEAVNSFGEQAVSALTPLLKNDSISLRARALWLLAKTEGGKTLCLEQLTKNSEPRLQITAFRALLGQGFDLFRLAKTMIKAPHPAVRAELALALKDQPYAQSKPFILALAKSYPAGDRTYLESFGLACEGIEEKVFADLDAKMASHSSKWRRTFEEIAWRLHPPQAANGFALRALAPGLSTARRRLAIDALGFMPSPIAAVAMESIARKGPEDLRPLARSWLKRNDSDIWAGMGILERIGGERPHDAKPVWRSGVMNAGLKTGEIDLTDVKNIWLVVTNGGDGNSCDWADWLDLTLMGPGGKHPLTNIQWIQAKADWGDIAKNKNCAGGPLKIDGQVFNQGIGTHAHSEIHFAIPPGKYSKLVFKVGPDDGGTAQNFGATSVEFQVFATGRPKNELLALNIAELMDDNLAKRDRRKIAKVLAEDPQGAMALLGLAAEKSLPDFLMRTIRDRIHRNSDFTVRALASKWFPKSDSDGRVFPTVKKLLELQGDAQRGQKVFFSKKASCSQCHTYDERGNDVGPNLTAIHTKYARAEILDNILNPSAGIAFGYDGWMIQTKDGQVSTGFLLADGPLVILKNTQGRKIMIMKGQIKSRRRLTLSTMPDNVALGLEPQELMDLVTFLELDANKKPSYGPTINLFNGKDLTGWTHFLNDPSAKAEDVWSVNDQVLQCKGNPIGYLRTKAEYTNFELTLEWRFDPAKGPGNSGVLLRLVDADKVWPKSIEAQLMHRNAGDIWNIDNVSMSTAKKRTQGRRTEKKHPSNERPLGEWNHYRILLNHGTLTLEVNGVLQNKAWECEEVPGKIALQSEGAAIEFRNIRIRPILDEAENR